MKLYKDIVATGIGILVISGALYSTVVDAKVFKLRPTMSHSATSVKSRPSNPMDYRSHTNTMLSAAVIMMLMNHPTASNVASDQDIDRCRILDNPEDDERCVQIAESIANQ